MFVFGSVTDDNGVLKLKYLYCENWSRTRPIEASIFPKIELRVKTLIQKEKNWQGGLKRDQKYKKNYYSFFNKNKTKQKHLKSNKKLSFLILG